MGRPTTRPVSNPSHRWVRGAHPGRLSSPCNNLEVQTYFPAAQPTSTRLGQPRSWTDKPAVAPRRAPPSTCCATRTGQGGGGRTRPSPARTPRRARHPDGHVDPAAHQRRKRCGTLSLSFNKRRGRSAASSATSATPAPISRAYDDLVPPGNDEPVDLSGVGVARQRHRRGRTASFVGPRNPGTGGGAGVERHLGCWPS